MVATYKNICILDFSPIYVKMSLMRRHLILIMKLREDFLCELLTEFNSPFIETEDVPDNTLDRDFVLIHGDQFVVPWEAVRRGITSRISLLSLGASLWELSRRGEMKDATPSYLPLLKGYSSSLLLPVLRCPESER